MKKEELKKGIFIKITLKELSKFGYHKLYSSMVKYVDDIRFHALPCRHDPKNKGILLHGDKVSRDRYNHERHIAFTEGELMKKEIELLSNPTP